MHKSTTTRSKQPVTSKKPEVLGILILTVSVLLGLSIISYHPSDFTFISKLSFFDLLASDTTARNVQNLLGPIGARLAHFFYALPVWVYGFVHSGTFVVCRMVFIPPEAVGISNDYCFFDGFRYGRFRLYFGLGAYLF